MLVVSLVPVGALAALGGAYSSSSVPLLIAAAAAFLLSGARVAATSETRRLDLALVAFAAAILLQLAPLPDAVVAWLSPVSSELQGMLRLRPASTFRPLSIDGYLTRIGLATAGAAILLFWAAREVFTRGGVRVAARTIALAGFAVSLVGLVQRTTAPTLLLWRWKPLDPDAQPFGPFVNRNHFATWLLMAASLAAGSLIVALRSHRFNRRTPLRLIVRDLLADGDGLLITGALAAMLLALAATLSRAGLLGALAAAACGAALGRRRARGDRPMLVGAAAVAMLLAAAVWVNREGLLGRLDGALAGEVGRPVIWTETLPLIRDVWPSGTGLGTYGEAMLRYQRTRTGTLFNQAHSEYLQILAEGGLLLTVPAALALWQWGRLARRRLTRDVDERIWIRVGAMAGLCGIAVQSVFENGLRMGANALLFALLAAVVVYEPKWQPRGSRPLDMAPPPGPGGFLDASPGDRA